MWRPPPADESDRADALWSCAHSTLPVTSHTRVRGSKLSSPSMDGAIIRRDNPLSIQLLAVPVPVSGVLDSIMISQTFDGVLTLNCISCCNVQMIHRYHMQRAGWWTALGIGRPLLPKCSIRETPTACVHKHTHSHTYTHLLFRSTCTRTA